MGLNAHWAIVNAQVYFHALATYIVVRKATARFRIIDVDQVTAQSKL